MPVILAYGDSNTHGSPPARDIGGGGRHPPGSRWPDAAAAALGSDWTVLNEGLPGRTTVLDDPTGGPWLNGLTGLPAVLHTHKPIDLVVIALGTNDLKARFSFGPFDVADGVRRLIAEIRVHPCGPDQPAGGAAPGPRAPTGSAVPAAPRILVVTPTPVEERGPFAALYAGAAERSRGLAPAFAAMAAQMGVPVFDAGRVVAVDPADGIHFSAESLQTLGRALAPAIRQALA